MMSKQVRFALIVAVVVVVAFGAVSLVTGNPRFFFYALLPAFLGVSSAWSAEKREQNAK